MEPDTPRSKPAQALFGVLLLAVGALMAGLCGLCTVAAGAWTLPSALFDPRGEGGYAIIILIPSLVIGGVATAIGATVFRLGHRKLTTTRTMKSHSLERLASAATLGGGSLFALAWLGVTVRMASLSIGDLLNPRPFDVGGAWKVLVVSVIVGGLASTLGAWIAWGGLKRLRAALREAQDG